MTKIELGLSRKACSTCMNLLSCSIRSFVNKIMKAAFHNRYGSPEVVKIVDIPRPTPLDDEVLIRVHASTVNRTDCGFRSAEYFISRFWSGLFKPKYNVLGNEFSGEVVETGSKVSEFKKGDKVFGYNDKQFGGHAEYLTISESAAITAIPDNFDYNQSAALTEGAHYALCDIRAAKIEAGQHVLINGATGAIGSAAVQLAKHFGAKVTAVCNTKNIELVRSLGPDSVIDYEQEDFTRTNEKFDFIFDAVGKSSYKKCKSLLKDNGIYISTELGKNGINILLALTTPLLSKKKLLFPIPSISKEDVLFLRELANTGKFNPVIDREYTLDQIVEAYHFVESGQKTGNVIIRLINEE